jgi:Uma2 family endonuclease
VIAAVRSAASDEHHAAGRRYKLLERVTASCYIAGMSVAFQLPMTLTEFLAWEERQDLRYEFDGFEPVDMTGGTIGHDQITFDLRMALAARLMGKPCRPFGPNVKIIVDGRVRYPDVFILCRPISPTATVAKDPVIVFEVLSESTGETDLIDKNREYRATTSILRYVLLQQTHQAAIVFVRRNDGWLSEIVSGDDATLDLPEIGIEVPLREIYANAGLPDPAPEENPPA